MKIDKVIFSSSEEYSDFWNIISKIFKTKFGFDCVCLFFGERKNTNISEEHGKVIDFKFIDNLPKVLQITWSKFFYTALEPETTWMIGDIDQLPLNKFWFTENISNIPDNDYVHLNATACAQNRQLPYDSWLHGLCDVPAHYHVAKGKTFAEFLDLRGTLEDQVKSIITKKIGDISKLDQIDDPTSFFWCDEERTSTRSLFSKLHTKKIHSFGYDNTAHKICRSRYDYEKDNYIYCPDKLKSQKYIDIHCERPYQKTELQIKEILNIAWGLE